MKFIIWIAILAMSTASTQCDMHVLLSYLWYVSHSRYSDYVSNVAICRLLFSKLAISFTIQLYWSD